MSDLISQIEESASYIQNRLNRTFPKIAIMMGSGLSSLADELTDAVTIPYRDIVHFPQSTVEGHKGSLVVGYLNGIPTCILAGRWHYYEGYSAQKITYPVRVMKALGVENMIFTNASGGVNENYESGDLVLLSDHINFIPGHPLRGPNDNRLGLRFPDMSQAYNRELSASIMKAAMELDINLQSGIYLALQGPSLETPAEYKMVHILGADMVGMSTVPEVIVANHSGMKVAAISIVSNVCYPPERLTETTMEEVLEVTGKASSTLNRLMAKVVVLMDK